MLATSGTAMHANRVGTSLRAGRNGTAPAPGTEAQRGLGRNTFGNDSTRKLCAGPVLHPPTLSLTPTSSPGLKGARYVQV